MQNSIDIGNKEMHHNQSQPIVKVLIQQQSNERLFSQKFILIMTSVENASVVSKDLVLQLISLFYQDNQAFIQLFQKSFLLIFKSLSQKDGRSFGKQNSFNDTKGYEQLLKTFFLQMIDMEFKVKKSLEQQSYFQNFVDRFLAFFAEALMSAKTTLRQVAYRILYDSLVIIQQHLQLELYQITKAVLLEATFYLLSLRPQQTKRKGIQLYCLLTKINLFSQQIQQLLFHYLQTLKNFKLRKLIIQSAIKLNLNSRVNNLDRFLNRLKDKNPLIVEEVIQKLITENIQPNILTNDQIIKILINGFGCYFSNVRHKAVEYLGYYFKKCIKFNQENPHQDNSFLFSFNKLSNGSSFSLDNLGDKKSGLYKFMKIFSSNGDDFASIFINNSFLSHMVHELISQVTYYNLDLAQSKTYILNIFTKISKQQTISVQQTIFIYSILNDLSLSKTNKLKNKSRHYQSQKSDNDSYTNSKKQQLIKWIQQEAEQPSPNQLIICLKNLLKNVKHNSNQLLNSMKFTNLSKESLNISKQRKNKSSSIKFNQQENLTSSKNDSQNIATVVYFSKIINILLVNFDVYDIVGRRVLKQELRNIIVQYEFTERPSTCLSKADIQSNQFNRKIIQQRIHQKMQKLTLLELTKISKILNNNILNNDSNHNQISIISNPVFDILSCLVQSYSQIIKQQQSDLQTSFQLKIFADELLQSKQLKFEYDMMKTIYQKASQKASSPILLQQNIQDRTQNQTQKKLSISLKNNNSHELSQQITKKIMIIQKKMNSNYCKGITILINSFLNQRSNSTSMSKTDTIIKVSSYFNLLKSELQHLSNIWCTVATDQIRFSQQDQNYIELILMLLYLYCSESYQNYIIFKKLLQFYAFSKQKQRKQSFQDDQNLSFYQNFIRLVSLRFLSELQIQYQGKQCQQLELKANQNYTPFVQTLTKELLKNQNYAVCQFQQQFYKEILVKLSFNSENRQNNLQNKLQALFLAFGDELLSIVFPYWEENQSNNKSLSNSQRQGKGQKSRILILTLLKTRAQLLQQKQSNDPPSFNKSFQQMLIIMYILCSHIFSMLQKSNSQINSLQIYEISQQQQAIEQQNNGHKSHMTKKTKKPVKLIKHIKQYRIFILGKFFAQWIEMVYFTAFKRQFIHEGGQIRNNLRQRLNLMAILLRVVEQIIKEKNILNQTYTFLSSWKLSRLLPQLILEQSGSKAQLKASRNRKDQEGNQFRSISIEQLIFFKRSLQKFFDFLKTKRQSSVSEAQNCFFSFSQELTLINESIQEEISRRVYFQQHICEVNSQSLSTQSISPFNTYNNNITQPIKVATNKNKDQLNFQIDTDVVSKYEKQIDSKVINMKFLSEQLSKYFQQCGLLSEIESRWQQKIDKSIDIEMNSNCLYNKNYDKTNQPLIQQQRMQQRGQQNDSNSQQFQLLKQQPLSHQHSITDQPDDQLMKRQTRRSKMIRYIGKNQFKSKYKQENDLQQCSVSLKKNKYIVFPYEIIQSAEQIEKMVKQNKILNNGLSRKLVHVDNENRKDASYRPTYKVFIHQN